jgi:hypothetical protein
MSLYAGKTREIHGRANGIYADEDEVERRGLETKLREDLMHVLDRTQYDEMRARTMAMELVDHTFAYTDGLTPAEARRIALARAGAYDVASVFGDSDKTEEDRAKSEDAFTNSIAEILGSNRFADYQRSQDASFREIVDFTRDNNLPKAKAVEVYEMRRLAEEEVRRLRADDSLDEAGRQQQLIRISTEIRQAASTVLGEQVYGQYLKSKGQWILNISSVEVH